MRNSTAPPNICFPSFYEMADLKDALASKLHGGSRQALKSDVEFRINAGNALSV
jgi:hypothetical protein